jgi:hypothetical protein
MADVHQVRPGMPQDLWRALFPLPASNELQSPVGHRHDEHGEPARFTVEARLACYARNASIERPLLREQETTEPNLFKAPCGSLPRPTSDEVAWGRHLAPFKTHRSIGARTVRGHPAAEPISFCSSVTDPHRWPPYDMFGVEKVRRLVCQKRMPPPYPCSRDRWLPVPDGRNFGVNTSAIAPRRDRGEQGSR